MKLGHVAVFINGINHHATCSLYAVIRSASEWFAMSQKQRTGFDFCEFEIFPTFTNFYEL